VTARIHPTAVLDPAAAVGDAADIGPYAVLGPGVTVGAGSVVGAHVVIERNATIGRGCYLGTGAVIGSDPQDLKYRGEETWVEIGDETRIREYVTVHRGSRASGRTRVGRRCFLMAYSHIGHDCVLEDDVTLANAVQLGGHVTLEAQVSIGGATAVHQFVRVGTQAFVGGGSRVTQDVPPFSRAAGNPLRLFGINAVGLRRAGLDRAARLTLQRAFRLIFNSDLTPSEALERLRAEGPASPEVERLVRFFGQSDRGVLV
jgi:UDP-N-acetylglucosamine acyltransferase